jgi:hypothetical protein
MFLDVGASGGPHELGVGRGIDREQPVLDRALQGPVEDRVMDLQRGRCRREGGVVTL